MWTFLQGVQTLHILVYVDYLYRVSPAPHLIIWYLSFRYKLEIDNDYPL